jgi:acyl carrier protein
MNHSEILSTLLEIARDVLDDDDLSFTPETLFDDIEEWDSLNHINMVVRMEKTFGIRFDTARLRSIVKVRDLIEIIADLKGA